MYTGSVVAGLSEDAEEIMEQMCGEFDNYQNDEEYKGIKLDKEYAFPFQYLKLDITDYSNNQMMTTTENISKTYIVVNQKPAVTFGRNIENDIPLNEASISRNHGQISFDDKTNCWYITDGFNGKASLNGTWRCITSNHNRKMKKESEQVLIKNGDSFKIGASIFSLVIQESGGGCKISERIEYIKEFHKLSTG